MVTALERSALASLAGAASVRVVRGDVVSPEQPLGVIFSPRLFQATLAFLQKRGALQEEHRERTQRRIDNHQGCVLACQGGGGETLDGAAHPPSHVVQCHD